MSRRITTTLLLAAVATSLATSPASASKYDAGCQFAVTRDPSDPQRQTWIEYTQGYFVGSPDVTQYEITCWLQTSPNFGVGELPNTRHTCTGLGNIGLCANPVLFQTAGSTFYQCFHVVWNETGLPTPPGVVVDPDHLTDLVDQFLADVFSTGGVTTLGGANSIVATATLAVTNLVAALQDTAASPGGGPTTYTETPDADPGTAGIQCRAV